MKEIVIVGAVRTPIGTFGGALKDVSAVELGTHAVKAVLKQSNLNSEMVDTLIFGNVLSSGLGQNVARQVALGAGIPMTATSFAVNKVCGSGLQSVVLAAQAILAGDASIVVCGGTESMSNAPFIVDKVRWGHKMGNVTMVDTMNHDGLNDAFEGYPMGITAENVARAFHVSREMQDTFSLESQKKAERAIENGIFKDEITPVTLETRKGIVIVEDDEGPRFGMTLEKLEKLRPVFEEGGTVTAGNSSGINDGASALVLTDRETAARLGLNVLATYVGNGMSGVDPSVMGIAPISATKNALEKVNWDLESLDLVEANEAFAAQSVAVINALGLNPEIVNVNGGAIALGHPIGASGARILVTLLHEMKRRNVKRGLATLCIGGGQGIAVLVER